MVKCKKCGKEIGNKNFCPQCGEKNEILSCPSCNSQIEKDNIFCPTCGEKIIKDKDKEEDLSKNDDKEEVSSKNDECDEEDLSKNDEGKEEVSSKDEDEKEDLSKNDDGKEEVSSKKDLSDENTKDESSKVDDIVEKSDTDNNEENTSKEYRICPHCKSKIYEDDSQYCIECGKSLDIDIQSFEGIKNTIMIKNLLVLSLISIIISVALSLLFSYLFGFFNQNIDLYPLGFFISLFIVVAIFGSFKDLINAGLLGIITGLVLGLLCNIIVELSTGFQFTYNMFYGYAPIFFTIFGTIIGIISSKYFRNRIVKFFDVEEKI